MTTVKFKSVESGYPFEFPGDHAPHSEFQHEWWYITAPLKVGMVSLGVQLTFFRVSLGRPTLAGLDSRWAMNEVWLGHFALSTPDGFRYAERIARPGTAHARPDDLSIDLGAWSLRRIPGPEERFRIIAAADFGSIDLTLKPTRPRTIHGKDGVHRKGTSETYASHYVTYTRSEVTGTVTLEPLESGKVSGRASETASSNAPTQALGAVSGAAWFDHEFFSSTGSGSQVGWDWLGLHLDDGSDLMAIRIRSGDTQDDLRNPEAPRMGDGTLVTAQNETVRLENGDILFEPLGTWESPKTGAVYPIRMKISIPSRGITLKVRPLRDDQELVTERSTRVTYWEGPVTVEGEGPAGELSGSGYYEMTGYAGAPALNPTRLEP